MAVIFAEQILSFAYDSTYGAYRNDSTPSLFVPIEGEAYKIVWDGTEYVSTAFTTEAMPGMVLVGNTILIGGENTGEPFAISSLADGSGMTIFALDTSETHTLAVYLGEEEDQPTEEETTGVRIVLYNRTGTPVTYDGVETITTDTPIEGETATFTYGSLLSGVEVELSMADGDQTLSVPAGYLVRKALLKKPETLAPEYIKKNIEIAGVVGQFAGDETEKTVDLNMTDGDQVIEADEDTVLKKVTVTKPAMLAPENIKKDVEIGGIVGTFAGSTEASDKVTFFDYDGEVVAEYTLGEAQSLTELPEAPVHEGLIFQGWNWTLEDIKNEIAITETMLNVGAMYITSDGKTRLYVDINHSSMQKVTMYFSQTVAKGVTVDWGDGSTSTRSTTGTGSLSHTYSTLGEYVITLDVADGCTLCLGYNSSSYGLFGKDNGGIANILQKVEIGKNVTSIGGYTFYYCYNLKSISLPNTITTFGTYAFRHAFALEYVTIPKGVTSLGAECFYYCFNLKHVSIPVGVTSVGTCLFDYCYTLEEIIFPSINAVYGKTAYSMCYGLKLLVNIATDGSSTYSVKKVVYKKDDGIIPEKLASYCYNVEEIHLNNNATTVNSSAFQGCYSLKKITLPDRVTTIGTNAFENCQSIEEITLPHGLTTIQSNAFNSCSRLRKLVISGTVTNIASPILNYAYSLREVHFLGETPPIFAGKLLNYGDISKCTFYVPKGTLDAYKSAAYLSTYASQIQEEE